MKAQLSLETVGLCPNPAWLQEREPKLWTWMCSGITAEAEGGQPDPNKHKQNPLDESLPSANAAFDADTSWFGAFLDSTC